MEVFLQDMSSTQSFPFNLFCLNSYNWLMAQFYYVKTCYLAADN